MLLATNSNQKRKDQNVEILGVLYVHSIFIAGTTQKLLCQALVWHTLQVSTQTKAQLSDVFWWCSWRNGYQELEQVHRHQMKDQGLTKHHEHRCLLSCQRIPIHTKLTSTTISTLIKISFKILLKNCHRNITYWIEITDCGGVGGGGSPALTNLFLSWPILTSPVPNKYMYFKVSLNFDSCLCDRIA